MSHITLPKGYRDRVNHKPHIRLLHGIWICGIDDADNRIFETYGSTPFSAYVAWKTINNAINHV